MSLELDIGKIVITIVNFAILYFILRHFLFNPVNNMISGRQNEINGKIKSTDENETKSKLNRTESEKLLKESRTKGKDIVEEYRAKAEKLSEEIIKEAKQEAQLIMDRASVEVDREKEKAKDEIKKEVVDLALLLSSKALEASIDEEQHRRLIKEFIAEVGI